MRKILHVPAERPANACIATKGEGERGLVFYSCLKTKPKNEGVCHQAGRTWQISVFSVSDLLQIFFFSFFKNSAGFCCDLLVSLRCVHMMFYPWHFLGLRAWLVTVLCISGRWETLLPGWGALHPTGGVGTGPSAMALVAALLPCLLGIRGTLHPHFGFNFILDWLRWSHTHDTLTYLRAESGLVYQLIDWLSFSCVN